MTMALDEQVRLLSLVDVLEPLSREVLEELGRRAPDTHLREGEIFLKRLERIDLTIPTSRRRPTGDVPVDR